jgi:hypothetical protein
MAGVSVEVTHLSGAKVSCKQVATFLAPNSTCACDVLVARAEAQERTATYAFQVSWCQPSGQQASNEKVEITEAWAERISRSTANGPTAGDNRAFPATVQDETARFALPTGATYEFHFETRKKRCLNPALTLHACCEGSFTQKICLAACERVVTYQFFDRCGKSVTDADASLENETQKLDTSTQGVIKVAGVEPGKRTLRSNKYELRPSEVHVDERMAQTFDIEAVQKAHAYAWSDREEIVVTIDDEIKTGEDVVVKFTDAYNVLVKTLKAEGGKPVSYHAPRGKPLKIQLLVDGEVTDEASYPSQ